MKTINRILLPLGALLLLACGGRGDPSTGLDPESRLAELDSQEIALLCTWAVEVSDGLLCQNGESLEGFTAYDCATQYSYLPLDCPATVANFESCILLLRQCGEDADEVLAACNPLITCIEE